MTNPFSQAATPAAAEAVDEDIRDEEGVKDTSHDTDGTPVGQADVEADAQRAEADAGPDH